MPGIDPLLHILTQSDEILLKVMADLERMAGAGTEAAFEVFALLWQILVERRGR